MSSEINRNYLKRRLILSDEVLDSTQPRKEMIELKILELTGNKKTFEFSELVRFFWMEFNRRWQSAQRKKDRFLERNKQWLDEFLVFGGNASTSHDRGGRPTKTFEDVTDRTKRRKTEDIRNSYSSDELLFATQSKFRTEGNKYKADFLKKVHTQRLSSEAALAIFVDAKLTKSTYELIRAPCTDVYPPYKNISEAKTKCYPPSESILLTETLCRVKLQVLLNHTSGRFLDMFDEKLHDLLNQGISELQLILKWGCDGSSGFNQFKQPFANSGNTDSSVFLTSMVPLRLLAGNAIIWQNPRPSSTRFCRPVSIALMKETIQTTQEEYERVKNEIENLQPLIYETENQQILVKFRLFMTMVDGKVINAITGTSSAQRCYLCKATVSQFNNLDFIKIQPVSTNSLDFGISSLHCWIRSFECLLHIAYRLEFKSWSKGGNEYLFKTTKAKIQANFLEKLGLHVDEPRQGTGNSNDGNTAREFFKNSEISAEITGINLELINKMRTILIAISCAEEVDPDKYKKFAYETAELYVNNYRWYHMPTTLHKLLLHGHEIINESMLPIGCMSEEAQEAMNKEIKRIRQHHSRKNSRENTMLDIFNGLMLASDPIVSTNRSGKSGKRDELPEEVREILK